MCKIQDIFKRFNITFSFTKSPPTTWQNNLEYIKGCHIACNLRVVNNTTERDVKLLEDFNQIDSKNKKQKQYTLSFHTVTKMIFK